MSVCDVSGLNSFYLYISLAVPAEFGFCNGVGNLKRNLCLYVFLKFKIRFLYDYRFKHRFLPCHQSRVLSAREHRGARNKILSAIIIVFCDLVTRNISEGMLLVLKQFDRLIVDVVQSACLLWQCDSSEISITWNMGMGFNKLINMSLNWISQNIVSSLVSCLYSWLF